MAGLNRTHIEHAAYALLMQAAVALVVGDLWLGAAFGAAFFVGREHAQAEARVPPGTRMPELEALRARYWSVDAMLDWIAPLVAVVAAAALIQR